MDSWQQFTGKKLFPICLYKLECLGRVLAKNQVDELLPQNFILHHLAMSSFTEDFLTVGYSCKVLLIRKNEDRTHFQCVTGLYKNAVSFANKSCSHRVRELSILVGWNRVLERRKLHLNPRKNSYGFCKHCVCDGKDSWASGTRRNWREL